jgi:Raf kinase inhibitor-like YbhB/YbcL family protein
MIGRASANFAAISAAMSSSPKVGATIRTVTATIFAMGEVFMKTTVSAALMAILLSFAADHVVSAEAPSPGAAQLALVNLPAKAGARLSVESPAFKSGGDIPYENTQYRGNIFPGLSWTAGPSGTRTYVIIMQDPDAIYNGMPILHWTMFNVPANLIRLDAAMTAPPAGASYGPNIRGANQAYMGPHTPPGPKHHYHLQLFALDIVLAAEAGADYAALTGAMKGHVLSEGELVGLAQADPTAPPPSKK